MTIKQILEELTDMGDWQSRFQDLQRRALELEDRRSRQIFNQRDSITRLLGHEGANASKSTAEIVRLNEELAAAQEKLDRVMLAIPRLRDQHADDPEVQGIMDGVADFLSSLLAN